MIVATITVTVIQAVVVVEITAATMISLESTVAVAKSDPTPGLDQDPDLMTGRGAFRGADQEVTVHVAVRLVIEHLLPTVANCARQRALSFAHLIMIETKLLPAVAIATDKRRLQSDRK